MGFPLRGLDVAMSAGGVWFSAAHVRGAAWLWCSRIPGARSATSRRAGTSRSSERACHAPNMWPPRAGCRPVRRLRGDRRSSRGASRTDGRAQLPMAFKQGLGLIKVDNSLMLRATSVKRSSPTSAGVSPHPSVPPRKWSRKRNYRRSNEEICCIRGLRTRDVRHGWHRDCLSRFRHGVTVGPSGAVVGFRRSSHRTG